ncbi:MAG: undecaprenyldiphospho-muramoylpentapeptide beta-N-acetylglucosaminyltransferase [Lachnoclostridium sp.]|nr:undecaprenyldiphospho-muramoylpentapeptide beta-N-acetylglucosaminyltransferase [Lachnoclostridium sp.]MDD7521153.1 undecaprenyldiphospho-muramoylpentapeptide beta-N-acetylglucosaminyltransferase [Lachnoclostridium sp.]
MKKIILTGGGTAGHVTPNIALIPELKKRGYEIHYIGSKTGIEKQLIEEDKSIKYYGISSGKLRRYFDVKNFTDPFRVLKGFQEAKAIIKDIKPDVVFSKGGFVTVPVVIAADKCKVPCIIHESDMTPGLANKICIPHAVKVCTNFPEAANGIGHDKAVVTGTPIRKEMFSGNKIAGLDFLGFTANKPVLMVVGGSLGAAAINVLIRDALPDLLTKYQVVHLCGKGKVDESLKDVEGYRQFEYIKKEMADLMAAADLIVSRAGANAICEILALNKPNLLIPLPAASSRGDQELNAESFERQGFSRVTKEEELTTSRLIEEIDALYAERDTYIQKMKENSQADSISIITNLIDQYA